MHVHQPVHPLSIVCTPLRGARFLLIHITTPGQGVGMSNAMQRPCPPSFTGHSTLVATLSRAGEPLVAGSQIVNIGAKLPQLGDVSNLDQAWELVRHTSVPLRVVAFEGDADNFRYLRHHAIRYASHALQKSQGKMHNVSLEGDYVHTALIASRLSQLGIQAGRGTFALLKIDIDSCDISIASAILKAGFEPTLLWVEHNQHVPLPIEFAALEPSAYEPFHATFGHWNSTNASGYPRPSSCMLHALDLSSA